VTGEQVVIATVDDGFLVDVIGVIGADFDGFVRGLVELRKLGVVELYVPLEGCASDTREVSAAFSLCLFVLWNPVCSEQFARLFKRIAEGFPLGSAVTHGADYVCSVTNPGALPICSIASTPSLDERNRLDIKVYFDTRIFHSPFTRAYTSS